MDSSEPILRREQLHMAGFSRKKGWLNLTPSRLAFVKGDSLAKDVYFDLPLDKIESVRAKKAFGAGEEHLEDSLFRQLGKAQESYFHQIFLGPMGKRGFRSYRSSRGEFSNEL